MLTHKPTRRILHTADLHMAFLGDKGCQGLESVVNTAIKRRADLLLIAGDLFDHNRVDEDLLEFVRAQFWRLPIPIVVLPGNHDCLVPGSVFSRIEFWKDCRNLHVFREAYGETLDLPYLNVSIWGKPIDTYLGDIHPMQDTPGNIDSSLWNIAVAHGYYVDTESPRFPSYHITEQEIAKHHWDYVALGHVPMFRCVCNDPVAYYSGSPLISGTAALVDLDEKTGVHVTRCLL
jgi:DNA repair exonuclease SbcCD nuclease subunit